ncbi:hypothetical protein [Lentzea sp. CA-135723]|uniref:hypothetical protein n=1 Tax=Lentzea sp. CA-135723 TaxID=3239950 RepID=UPI003D92C1B2
MGAKGFFGATRAHRRTARVADLIEARQGEVVRERRYGGRGLQPSPSRAIVTVRRGQINDVFLPRIEVTAFPSGTEFVENSGEFVPDGHTGIVVDIST